MEHKRKYTEDRAKKKVEKDPRHKKKAKATKGGDLEPSEIATKEGPSEPHFDHLVELLPSSSHLIVEVKMAYVESDRLGPNDYSVVITIPVGVTLEEGV